MTTIDNKIQNDSTQKMSLSDKITEYWKGCIEPNNAKLYGTFQERAALNITQFPKIQGSLLIRMGIVYPIASYFVEQLGLSKESHSEILAMTINYHTWIAGYTAYLLEIQSGLSKYAIEGISKGIAKIKEKYIHKEKHTITTIDNKIQNDSTQKMSLSDKIKSYWNGCIDKNNAKLYGTFQERAALNITQFPKIQGSLLIRMGIVYPIASYFVEQLGLSKESHSEILAMTINYHTWIAGYTAYLLEIQSGLSKYAIEGISKGIAKIKEKYIHKV